MKKPNRKNCIKMIALFFMLSGLQSIFGVTHHVNNTPDSAFLFAYATDNDYGRNGLHFAWSIDKENWHPIGPEHSFLRCDYGRWGTEKRMVTPVLIQDKEGVWHCLWNLNENDGAFAHATSRDLVSWKRQSYPEIIANDNCLLIEAGYNSIEKHYFISWISNKENEKIYAVTTTDFKNYTTPRPVPGAARTNQRDPLEIDGKDEVGTIHKVSWNLIENLINAHRLASYKNRVHSETTKEDPVRFVSLKPIHATITIHGDQTKEISNLLLGIFFEDINYAADGGLYAELVQNRGFEYALSDKENRDPDWNSYKAWQLKGEQATFIIDTASPIHPNNKHYAVLEMKETGARLINEGFDGIAITSGENYNISLFARSIEGNRGKITVRLTDKNGKIYGESTTKAISSDWKKYETTIRATSTLPDAQLEIIPQSTGKVALDMISLFPQKTFKGRKNGLRQDLAQTIADMNPRFVRFPGGCVAHGDGLGNMYRWKNTIGPLETRKPQRNLWGYHQSAGLGYFEYFQFCEDIGAEPIPVVPAGVPCQNSATGGGGQQGGIPLCEMDDYIQEVLDLIEYANGDKRTTWGKKRAEAGHPEPFNLKYIGIGNEDLVTDIFEERFTLLLNAIKEKHPEITVIGTVGPASEGTDYEEGWQLATKLNIAMVDEHYYQPPGWFIHNQDYYDKYDRNKSKVYLGEYAAHLPGRPNNIETALAEALYLTSLERNGDIVSMTSYAPLLAKEGYTQWNPDLIYFNNTKVKPTTGYYVQMLYGQNAGDRYIKNTTELSETGDAVRKRIGVSIVKDSNNNDLIIKLVNLLPVSVTPEFKLENITINDAKVVKTVLQGRPDDKNAKPETTFGSVSDMLTLELPAYSFTIYRVKAQ